MDRIKLEDALIQAGNAFENLNKSLKKALFRHEYKKTRKKRRLHGDGKRRKY